MFKKNNKRVMNGWAFYDWANSVYNLVITSTIFPLFYAAKVGVENGQDKEVIFFGRTFLSEELYSYVISGSAAVLVILLPFLSGIADYKGTKKRYLKFFCYLGSAASIALFWFDPDYLELSMVPVFLASVGFWSSLVFYNSYLPDIATPDQHDRLSAKGFSLGYIGSVLLLTMILIGFKVFDMPVKYGFLAVGVWWAGFAQITYRRLPNDVYGRSGKIDLEKPQIYKGFLELKKVFIQLQEQIALKRYLAAYFIYNTGVQTVMVMAVIFAEKEINWPLNTDGTKDTGGLLISVMLIQLVAIVGATLMARMTKFVGNINVIRVTLVVWITVCIIAFRIHTPKEFYILACIVGFVMGAIQGISRSTYAKMLPKTEDTTSYFSFYDSLEKVGLAVGPFLFGYIAGITGTLMENERFAALLKLLTNEESTGGMRVSILMLTLLFLVGFLLLFWVKPNFRNENKEKNDVGGDSLQPDIA